MKWASTFPNHVQLLPQKHLPQEPRCPISSHRQHRQQGWPQPPGRLRPHPPLGCLASKCKKLESGPWKSFQMFLASERAFCDAGNTAGVGVWVYPVGTSVLLHVSHAAPRMFRAFQGKQTSWRESRGLHSQPGAAWRGDTWGWGSRLMPPMLPPLEMLRPAKSLPSRAQHGHPTLGANRSEEPGPLNPPWRPGLRVLEVPGTRALP